MIGTTYWVEVILSAEIGTAEVRHSESGVSVMLEQGESLDRAISPNPKRPAVVSSDAWPVI